MKAWRRHNAKKEAREHALANSALTNGDVKKWHAHEMKAHRAGKHAMGRHGGSAVNIPMGPPPLADGGAPIVVDQENIPPVGAIPDAPPVVLPPASNVPGLPPSLPADNNFGFPPAAPASNAIPVIAPTASQPPVVVPPTVASASGLPPSWPPAGMNNARPLGAPSGGIPMGPPPTAQPLRGASSGGIPILADSQAGGPPPGAIPVIGGEVGDADSISIREGENVIEVKDGQQPNGLPPNFNSNEITYLPSVIMPSAGSFSMPPPVVMPPPVIMPPPVVAPPMMPPSVMVTEPRGFVEEIIHRPFPNAGSMTAAMRLAGEPIVVQEWGGMIDATVETSYWTEPPTVAGAEVIEERTLIPMAGPTVEETTVLPPMPVGVPPVMPMPGPTEVVSAGPPMPVGMPPVAPMTAPTGRAQLPPRQMNSSPIPSGPPTMTRDFNQGRDNTVIPILPPAPVAEQGPESQMPIPMRGQSPMGDQSHFMPILDDGNLSASGRNNNNTLSNVNPITGPPGSTPFPTNAGGNDMNGISYLPPKFMDFSGNEIDPAVANQFMGNNMNMMGMNMNAQQMQQMPPQFQNPNQMFGGMGSRGNSPSDIELRANTPPIGGFPNAPSPRAADSRTVSSIGGTLTRDDLRDSWSMAVPTVPYRGPTPPPPMADSMVQSAAYPYMDSSEGGSVRSARSVRSSGSVNAFTLR